MCDYNYFRKLRYNNYGTKHLLKNNFEESGNFVISQNKSLCKNFQIYGMLTSDTVLIVYLL